jgi:hypothetical protein
MPPRVASLVLGLTVGGCVTYTPGSFTAIGQTFPGHHASFACLDLALTLTDDPRTVEPVIQYSFGNRCWGPAVVDLASPRVVARFADGTTYPVKPFDPRRELRALTLDGRWYGEELIAYTVPFTIKPTAMCVDAAAIAHADDGPRWVCVGATDGGPP